MSFLLCGQTDSGKSTCAGHLLYQVGFFNSLSDGDTKDFRKYIEDIETQSTTKSKFSILMDLMDGEITTNKTKTQEFNMIEFNHNNKQYTIIDTPGHKLYIRELIAGLFKVHLDIVVVVISTIEKEFIDSFEKGTIKEDLLLCRSSNCKNLLVLWNKSDLATLSTTNKDRFLHYCKKLQFKNIEQLNVSGYTGDHLMDILPIVDKYRQPEKEKKEITHIEQKTIYIEGIFYPSSTTIITAGYMCILHNESGEYEINIDAIKKTHIVKHGVPILFKVSTLNNSNIYTYIGERTIFRNSDTTLGFGVVRKL